MEPSAHALGYRLTALRAWGQGLGPESAQVHRDGTRFFPVRSRCRCRCRYRYRRVMRGVAGLAHCPPGSCRFGGMSDGNSVLLRLSVIFAAILPGLRPKGLTRRREDAKGQWAGSRLGRFRVGGGLARWSAARGGTAKRAGVGLAHAKTQRRKGGKGRRPDAIPCLSWGLCVLSEAGVRNPFERGVAVRCVKKRGICRPSGAGCAWGDGTQRSRAGLSSVGPPGLGAWLGKTRSCQGVAGSNPVLPR
jgi:hypothetical protein